MLCIVELQRVMDVIFSNTDLAAIETKDAAKTKLPVAVIKSVRRKLTVLRAATDERTLREWKSLHYKKLQGGMDGYRSIRVNDKYRIVLQIDTDANPNILTIFSIEDYHK